MSKLQYIGLRYIFEYEITHSKAPYVELLKNAMDKLLDAKLTREEFKNYQAKFLYEATAPQNKFRKKAVSSIAHAATVGATVGAGILGAGLSPIGTIGAVVGMTTPIGAIGAIGAATGAVAGMVTGATTDWFARLNSKDDDIEIFQDDNMND